MAKTNLLERCPREIRDQIYGYLFFPNVDHVLVRGDPQDETKPRLRIDRTRRTNASGISGYGLLAACRMTHTETVPMCYPTVRFVLVDGPASNAWIKQHAEAHTLWMLKKIGLVTFRRPDPSEMTLPLYLSSEDNSEMRGCPIEACRIMTESLAFTEDLSLHVDLRASTGDSPDDYIWCNFFGRNWDVLEMKKLKTALQHMPALKKLIVPGIVSTSQIFVPTCLPVDLPNLRALEVDASFFRHGIDPPGPVASTFGIDVNRTEQTRYTTDYLLAFYVSYMRNITWFRAPLGAWIDTPRIIGDIRFPHLETLILTDVWDVMDRMLYEWHPSFRNTLIRTQLQAICFQFRDSLKRLYIEECHSSPMLVAGDDVERASQLVIWHPLMVAVEDLPHLTHLSIVGQVAPLASFWLRGINLELEYLELDISLNSQWIDLIRDRILDKKYLRHLTVSYSKSERVQWTQVDYEAKLNMLWSAVDARSNIEGASPLTFRMREM